MLFAIAGLLVQNIALLSISAIDNELDVKLTVSDALGIIRNGEIVCSGVPFGEGILRVEDQVCVQTLDGTPLPTQTKALGKWQDGSVKWLLVQFPVDCNALSSKEYYLRKGESPASSQTINISDNDDHIRIDTGTLCADIPKDRLTFIENACLNGNINVTASGTPMDFILEDGTILSSADSKPESITIEEDGLLRTTIRVIGWIKDKEQNQLYRLDTRLRFYAGKSYVRADYTFICLGQPSLHHIKEISLNIKPDLGEKINLAMPDDSGMIQTPLSSGERAILSVDDQMVCSVGLEDNITTAESHLDGWSVLADEGKYIGVAVRDFWHLCPKAIEVSSDKIKIELWDGSNCNILNLGRTRAKTHQILYDFGTVKADNEISDHIRAFHNPLIAITDPEYFCDTDALGTLSPSGAVETAKYDQKIEQSFDALKLQRKEMPRENGMLHYGDYYHGGYGNKLTRGDLEYDTAHACFLLYARSGDRKYYDFAVATNQHFIDIDINQETGEQRFHGYSENADTHEAVTTGMEWGHLFVDGPAEAYYLTGDERSLDSVRMISDCVATIADGEGYDKIRGIFAGAERQLGWPLDVLCRSYEVIGDEKYLNAATKIINFIKSYAKDPLTAYQDGKWWRSWMMDGCKVFMTGELHDGLNAYYNITHDKELKDVIVKSLNWLIDNMWNPETDGFMYEFNAMNRPHRIAGMSGLNMLVVDAFISGYQMTDDRRYLSVAMRSFWSRVKEMEIMEDGKQFSIDTRTSPHTAAYFYKEHITTDNMPESPQPIAQQLSEAPKAQDAEMLLHADFDDSLDCETPKGKSKGNIVGNVEFVNGRNGKAISVGKDGYVWFDAPSGMLRLPGSIELWVSLNFKKNETSPQQSAVFHIEGENPLIDSLCACTIYGELRIRMKDHVGHLHGSAEGEITQWNPGEWHHVVVTWDNEKVKLYLDGEEQIRPDEGKYAGDDVVAFPSGKQTRVNLGWRFGNWYCDCAIDSITIYSKALSPSEISGLFK